MALAAWGQISHDAATKILSGAFSLSRRRSNILGGVFSRYKTGLDNTLKKHFLISVKNTNFNFSRNPGVELPF